MQVYRVECSAFKTVFFGTEHRASVFARDLCVMLRQEARVVEFHHPAAEIDTVLLADALNGNLPFIETRDLLAYTFDSFNGVQEKRLAHSWAVRKGMEKTPPSTEFMVGKLPVHGAQTGRFTHTAPNDSAAAEEEKLAAADDEYWSMF